MNETATLAQKLSDPSVLQNLSTPLQVALFLGALALLPAAMVSLTSFTRIVIVLSFARRAVTSQEIPPNSVILGLSLFLTFFVMSPVIDEMNSQGITPYLDKKIGPKEAFQKVSASLQKFMLKQTRRQDLALFVHMSGIKSLREPSETPFRVLVPAFVISELKTAFMMGFLIYLPFLLVDLVVSSVLTSMGMVMMPPVLISAPFKILLFVLADGWHLVVRALSLSFA
jgi:flagellar biosynthesis protein FliP